MIDYPYENERKCECCKEVVSSLYDYCDNCGFNESVHNLDEYQINRGYCSKCDDHIDKCITEDGFCKETNFKLI